LIYINGVDVIKLKDVHKFLIELVYNIIYPSIQYSPLNIRNINSIFVSYNLEKLLKRLLHTRFLVNFSPLSSDLDILIKRSKLFLNLSLANASKYSSTCKFLKFINVVAK